MRKGPGSDLQLTFPPEVFRSTWQSLCRAGLSDAGAEPVRQWGQERGAQRSPEGTCLPRVPDPGN